MLRVADVRAFGLVPTNALVLIEFVASILGTLRLWVGDGQTFNNPTPASAGNFLAELHWKRQRAPSRSFKMISFSNRWPPKT